MLVALRSVKLNCERVDTIAGSLVIEAECLQSSPSSQQYAFKVSAADEVLCEGRAAVVLGARRPE
jgi:predicted hotdog family 3-hydroxylacyl-ACP dehydratase